MRTAPPTPALHTTSQPLRRLATVQTVFGRSPDILDRTAATLIIQAIMAKDLDAINQIFQRIEGGSLEDVLVLENAQVEMRL